MKLLLKENREALGQAEGLLSGIDPRHYTERIEICHKASIGGHMRHVIEHYLCFLRDTDGGRVDYEQRPRDIVLESDPKAALSKLRRIEEGFARIELGSGDHPLSVRMEDAPELAAERWGKSSTRRELQFLLSHTIHHYALIAVNCRILGLDTPEGFGVAPSTLRHRASLNRTV